MIKIIANWILNFVCKNCDISTDLREVYQYGIEITISSIFNILLIIATSLLFRDFLSGMIFLLCFISLRTYSGGYNATTYLRCNVVFLITYILVEISHIFLSHYFLSNIRFSEVLLLIFFLPVLIYAPVHNKHKKLDEKKKHKNKILSVIIYIILAVIALLLHSCKSSYGMTMVMTLAAVSTMILIEIFMQRRGIP